MKISEILTVWYKLSARELPWRRTSDPYLIWISEIILQQTRISQGMDYYTRITERFPTVESLAGADEDELMRLWQGLGYYSRARNMQFAAKQVVSEYGGRFPSNYEALLGLKGVGSYTAAAVASIAFGEPRAVVDGNVSRVLSRLFLTEVPINTAEGARIIQDLADRLLDSEAPGTHNQAVMEFGALQCVPSNPDCGACPLNSGCLAYSGGAVDRIPVKIKKARVKERFFTFMVINRAGHTYLRKRSGADIWKSLYEFPMIESTKELREEELPGEVASALNMSPENLVFTGISRSITHILSHRKIIARFVHVDIVGGDFAVPSDWTRTTMEEVGEFAVPRLVDRYMNSIDQ